MVRKVQLPVIGGVRKSVIVPNQQAGTTIADFGPVTITLTQLKAALGIVDQSSTSGGTGTSAPAAALALGPGLSGGGPLIGAVPIRLTAPIPANMEDPMAEESFPIPGPRGPAGPPGPPGPALFFLADEPIEEVVFMTSKL